MESKNSLETQPILLHNPAYELGYGTRVIEIKGGKYEIKNTNYFSFFIAAYIHGQDGASTGFLEDYFKMKLAKDGNEHLSTIMARYITEHPADFQVLKWVIKRRDEEERHRAILRQSIEAGKGLPRGSYSHSMSPAEQDLHDFMFSQTIDQIGDMTAHMQDFQPQELCEP